jgi:hypothetical protein
MTTISGSNYCQYCDTVTDVEFTRSDWDTYRGGELVQRVWPSESTAFREVMISLRTGIYCCPYCESVSKALNSLTEEV